MAHPYAKHSEHRKSHQRVGHIMRSGGVAKHIDEADDRKLFRKMIAEHENREIKVGGRVGAKRYARGGKVKGKGKHQTNIAIVVPQHRPSSGSGPQAGAAVPLPPSAAPAPPMGPGLPPGAPPPGAGGPPGGGPGGPGGMPPFRRGGKISGGATAGNIAKSAARASKNSYARGGRLTASAASGEGRLEKAHLQK